MSNDNLVKAIEALMLVEPPAPLTTFGFRFQSNGLPYVFGHVEGEFVSVTLDGSSAQEIAASLIEKAVAMKAKLEAPRSIADAELGQHFAEIDRRADLAVAMVR